MLANFSIWHSVAECSTIFQFSPLWRNARQFVNLVHCDGMFPIFSILPSVTGCSPIIRICRCICMCIRIYICICIYISDSGALRQNAHQFFNLALCDKMLANFSIWHSVTECSTIFQFSPLWRNTRQFHNLTHCDGLPANFLILPSVTGCSPIFKFRALQRNARQFFKLALCDGMPADFSQNTPRILPE